MSEYGTRNPAAPHELALFDFLIGRWEGTGTFALPDGTSNAYSMRWTGRYILDGRAIADEARIFGEEGELERLFVTYRYYEPEDRTWIIEAFDALESTLHPQAPAHLGGVQVEHGSISLLTSWPDFIGRERFQNISKDSFEFRLDVSRDNGQTWISDVDKVDARRQA